MKTLKEYEIVRGGGFEPPQGLSPLDPQSSASARFRHPRRL